MMKCWKGLIWGENIVFHMHTQNNPALYPPKIALSTYTYFSMNLDYSILNYIYTGILLQYLYGLHVVLESDNPNTLGNIFVFIFIQ